MNIFLVDMGFVSAQGELLLERVGLDEVVCKRYGFDGEN